MRGGEREIGKETYKIFHEGENRFLRQQSAPVKGRKHQMPTVRGERVHSKRGNWRGYDHVRPSRCDIGLPNHCKQ